MPREDSAADPTSISSMSCRVTVVWASDLGDPLAAASSSSSLAPVCLPHRSVYRSVLAAGDICCRPSSIKLYSRWSLVVMAQTDSVQYSTLHACTRWISGRMHQPIYAYKCSTSTVQYLPHISLSPYCLSLHRAHTPSPSLPFLCFLLHTPEVAFGFSHLDLRLSTSLFQIIRLLPAFKSIPIHLYPLPPHHLRYNVSERRTPSLRAFLRQTLARAYGCEGG
ncbi:uncharacterized protein K489DRAFT_98256 [Dissoconium aciculare CBS 342.82]|uniref:Uncharacterized protein n=1 Tax=Dissoconium aciculare CBS 342.82 TaxID=1314786 RepID=A0A6J3MCM9_9PEZI|nr:uncharacterized protein K489DRAFT_98256 [Dissoconium aciculare CBS 342.82]KAF1825781.1 hypothetical protein K489DRAFT_98256 [Dissoconium aciculare CBS 342.82]